MSFHGGLAASPDPSNDVVYSSHIEHSDPHYRLLEDARNDVIQDQIARAAQNDGDDASNSQAGLLSFDYTGRNLESLPYELADLIKDHAARLALGNNRLTGLSGLTPCMGEFKQLTYLVLRHNLIHEFPRDVLLCTSLETLDLTANSIDTLPDDLPKLRNLKRLCLDRNKLTRVPTCITKMSSLHYIQLANNPIEFPEKSTWRIHSGNRSAEDAKNFTTQWDRLGEETKLLKRALSQYEKSERSPESDLSEVTTDTPKPVRKKTGGRFPVRPSLSGVDLDAAANSASHGSPANGRPPLKSSKTSFVPTMSTNGTMRPGIAPLVSRDRNRSNSETNMLTSRRQKRMGVHVSKGGNSSGEMSFEGSIDLTNDQSKHARGTSGSSLIHQVVHKHVNGDSLSADNNNNHSGLSRSASYYEGQNRLSSLPEHKRKSLYHHPDVSIAEEILYTIEQTEKPIKKLVVATKPAGPKRRSLERCCYAAFANKADLAQALNSLEALDEDAGEKRSSVVDLHERCERAMSSFQNLCELLQSHAAVLMEYAEPRDMRLGMLMAYNAVIELKSTWSKQADALDFSEEEQQTPAEVIVPTPVPIRQASPSPRPATSLRVRDRGRVAHHQQKSSTFNKPLPSPRSLRSTSGTSLLSRMPSYASTISKSHLDYAPPTPSLTPATSFPSTVSSDHADDEEDDRVFEKIFEKLKDACNMASESLNHCRKIFVKMRDHQRKSTYGGEDIYYEILRNLEYAINACSDLKSRLQTMRVREPQTREQLEFWQIATGFTKAFTVFVTSVKNAPHPDQIPDAVKALLRPVHHAVKGASALIEASPWTHLAVHGPNSAGPSPAISGSMPFSMSYGNNPPPVPPPAKDLPIRPTHHSQHTNGLGLQTSWGSSASLNSSSTFTSNTGTIRAAPTSHPTSYPRESGASSTTPTPSNLSRASSRAGNYANPAPPMSTPNYGSYFADATPTEPSMPNSARFPPSDSRYGAQSYVDTRYDSRYAPSLPELSPHGSTAGTRSGYSSGYSTPLPPTPMSAALGPAAQPTLANESNTGTMKKIPVYGDAGSHSHQNSFDNVVTNGYSGVTSSGYTNGYSSGYGKDSNTWYGDLTGGPGAAMPASRAINGGRPNVIERSVSAAGHYPSAVPQRMASSRNVSRSASQRR